MSLRDVERAMIVFEWFFDKHDIIKMELKDLENKVYPVKTHSIKTQSVNS